MIEVFVWIGIFLCVITLLRFLEFIHMSDSDVYNLAVNGIISLVMVIIGITSVWTNESIFNQSIGWGLLISGFVLLALNVIDLSITDRHKTIEWEGASTFGVFVIAGISMLIGVLM